MQFQCPWHLIRNFGRTKLAPREDVCDGAVLVPWHSFWEFRYQLDKTLDRFVWERVRTAHEGVDYSQEVAIKFIRAVLAVLVLYPVASRSSALR